VHGHCPYLSIPPERNNEFRSLSSRAGLPLPSPGDWPRGQFPGPGWPVLPVGTTLPEEGSSREGLMSETAKRRRRWPWLFLAALLVLVGGPVAWQFRPLTPAERALVGHWRSSVHDADYHLSSDHRFQLTLDLGDQESLPVRGSWTASGSSFHVRAVPGGSPWKNPLRHWCAWISAPTESANIRLDGPDRFWMNNVEFVRVRD